MHTHMHTYTYTYTYTHMHTHTYTNTHTHTHTRTHTCIHRAYDVAMAFIQNGEKLQPELVNKSGEGEAGDGEE
jgi:hypothetical protein